MGRLISLFSGGVAAAMAPAALALLIALAPAGMAFADDDHDKAKRLREAGDILPLEEILKKATAVRPGRIIEAELDEERGVYIYEIEILDKSGTVRELRYDAKTGKPLGEKED